MMSTLPGEELLKGKKNWKLRNPVVGHGVESLENEGRSARRSRYLSRRKLLFNYIENDGERAPNANQRAELGAWQGWIGEIESGPIQDGQSLHSNFGKPNLDNKQKLQETVRS